MYIYFLLILFFASFFGIVFMIGKKLSLQNISPENDRYNSEEDVLLEIPHLGKVKPIIVENAKKYGHLSIIVLLRIYIKSKNFLRNKYEIVKFKINNRLKSRNKINNEEKEISKFLKTIGDYKHKIRAIKEQIHEEEKKNL